MSKYRVAEVMECPTCNGKGYTVRKLAWWQKFLGLSAKVPCYCSFDAHLGTHVIVTWVDLESAQQSVQPTDGGLAQADDESNLPPSSANASRSTASLPTERKVKMAQLNREQLQFCFDELLGELGWGDEIAETGVDPLNWARDEIKGLHKQIKRLRGSLELRNAAEHRVQADVLARCAKCNALIETTVHCDNCGTFEPTRS